MIRFSCMIILLISAAGYSQTYNKNALGYSISGSDKVARKDYSGAVEDFSMAIKLDPTFKQAYENRGVAKFYLQDYNGAILNYTRAIEIDPDGTPLLEEEAGQSSTCRITQEQLRILTELSRAARINSGI